MGSEVQGMPVAAWYGKDTGVRRGQVAKITFVGPAAHCTGFEIILQSS